MTISISIIALLLLILGAVFGGMWWWRKQQFEKGMLETTWLVNKSDVNDVANGSHFTKLYRRG